MRMQTSTNSDQPHMSLNKFAEYSEASASRRTKIIIDQKQPVDVIVARYGFVYSTLSKFLSFYRDDESYIKEAIESLSTKHVNTTWQEDDKKNSLLALKQFQGIGLPDLSKFKIEKYTGKKKYITIEGVKLSINPDLIISGIYRGKNFKGAIKNHISKNNCLTPMGQDYVTTLLQKFVTEHCLKKGETVSLKHCISIDVFAKRWSSAPKSYIRLMKDVISACHEINSRWDKL